MKLHLISPLVVGAVLSATPAKAALSDQLVGYYNFEETGTTGLANKAPGATDFNATRFGGGTFDSSENPSGPGFTGMATFTSAVGTSARATLLAGNALNLSDDRNDAIIVPLGTTQLGNNFSISAWHYLAPGSATTKARFHVFESSDTGNYDVSWGTALGSNVNYLSYLATGTSLPSNGLAVGAWHHVVQTFSSDGTNTTLTTYVDGVKAGTLTAATSAMNFTALHFGRARAGTDDRDWDGMLDEIGVWSRALTDREVKQLRARGVNGAGALTDLATLGKAYVDVAVADPATGTVDGSGVYNLNEVAQVTAHPATGYAFTDWTGLLAGQTSNFAFAVTGDVVSNALLGPDNADTDGDGLTNYQEAITYHTDPQVLDTDGDGVPDGAEVNQTGTSPIVSNATLFSYLTTHLDSVKTGEISGNTTIQRDPATGNLTLSLGLKGSTDGATWTNLPLNGPGTTVTNTGEQFELTLPAPSATVETYRVFRH